MSFVDFAIRIGFLVLAELTVYYVHQPMTAELVTHALNTLSNHFFT